MGLSKGTLGLKFMNRQAPAAPPAAAPPPAVAAAPGPSTSHSTSATAHSVRSAGSAGSTKASVGSGGSKQAAAGTAGAATSGGAHAKATLSRESTAGASTGARTASRPAVVHESSLLSFPLLSTLNRTSAPSSAAAATTTSSMASSYSSMPLTSAMVSGRRSFGGANIEIEKLNDPSSHQAPPPGADDKSKSRRPKKGDRDAALVPSVRRGGTLSGSKAAKRTADLDQARGTESVRTSGPEGDEAAGGGGKKKRRKTDENGVAPRWEVDDDEVSLSGRRATASGSTWALAARKAESGSLSAPAAGAAAAAGFARPAGFDGLKKKKKQAASAPKKDKGNAVEEDYQWTKRGETREWDQGKDDDSDEDDSSGGDEELMVSGDSDEDSDDDDSEMDEAILDDEERKFAEAADQGATSKARSRKGRGTGKPAQRGRGGR